MSISINTRTNMIGLGYEQARAARIAREASQSAPTPAASAGGGNFGGPRPSGQPPRIEVPIQPRQSTDKPASPAQLKFIRSLLSQLGASDDLKARAEAQIEAGLTSREASAKIDQMVELRDRRRAAPVQAPVEVDEHTDDLRVVTEDLARLEAAGRLNEFGQSLLDQYRRNGRLSERQIAVYLNGMSRRQPRGTALPEVPEGRYAVDSAEGELRFYRINRAQSGKVYIHVQHGGQESEVPFGAYCAILQSIVDAGPAEAAIRYGREIGACSRCGIRLTNRLSRELGIGPICGGHWHDEQEWRETRSAARAAIVARGEDPDENMED